MVHRYCSSLQRVLKEVLLVSLAVQLVALATPLFFQVVVDKVLVQQSMATLNVVTIGLGLAILFDVVLSALRSYLLSHTANRIDVEMGATVFRRLIDLPLLYYQQRRVGDSVARMRELENIRQTITSSGFSIILDLGFGGLFLALIFLYSVYLGLVVLASVPLYCLLSLLATPLLRARLQEKFRYGAENHSFLVESVSNIETVKALAAEPVIQGRWEESLSAYVRSAFRVAKIGLLASQLAQLLAKLTTLAILYVGALLIIGGHLTVGELIAANMLAGQVTNPILRLAQVWQDFQQLEISVDRVSDILRGKPESARQSYCLAGERLRGDITFEKVSYSYTADAPPALDRISLSIRQGEVLGIIGPSGSGKSTLAKVVQRLYVPQSGAVKIDGVDINVIDIQQLRRQIGVVPQDSVLFNISVRDNISLSNPTLSSDAIVSAARLSGAHEFIVRMAQGYDTIVGERGTTLSGGQRQRIAIARALVAQPSILIFDEATSALDLESEEAIQANMASICRGRTVIIIAHRLTAVRYAHRIISIDAGRIVEDGHPVDLLSTGGLFSQLYASQRLNFERVSTPI